MTSPPVSRISKSEISTHHLVTPTARICVAAIILMTGAGISAVFWKMPSDHEMHALCQAEMIDKNLAATPLPSESIAMLSPEERGQMVLPELNIAPATDDGSGKYANVHPPQASWETVPQNLEPMRPIVEEKPFDVEPVSRDFQTSPAPVSTIEKSDEMLSKFHFAGNIRADFDEQTEPESPADPFPGTAIFTSTLQQLQPIELSSLTPLLPLRESDLLPFSELVTQ
ncbi:MAG: hypothetical protein LBI05_02240 [Planctomycetaceae bacterium]|jgi:hypothetical protein|nr:hypothetical protein [Planctomycetaceae bacterium]